MIELGVNKGIAYVTLLLNDNYLPGALVLAKSLRNSGSKIPLVLLYVKSQLSDKVYNALNNSVLFDRCINVDLDVFQSRNEYELNHLLKRRELSKTFTKLNVWRLVDYEKVIYLDSDMIILDNIDNLFDNELPLGGLSAVSDSGWPDIFNSGLFVTKPDLNIFNQLKEFYETNDSFDGADQGILNEFFNLQSEKFNTKWNRLPFIYNCTLNSNYEYLPAMVRFQSEIKVAHFIGKTKPWIDRSLSWNCQYPKIFKNKNLFGLWWEIYDQLHNEDKAAYPSPTHILEISGHLQSSINISIENKGVGIQGQLAGPIESSSSQIQEEESNINPVVNHQLEDVSHIHFPMYYYKHKNSEPIVDESYRGEAWKLTENKVEWPTNNIPIIIEPEEERVNIEHNDDDLDDQYQERVNAIDQYVKNNPIFPWEGTLSRKASRTFKNLNKFEPPSYSIAIMDSETSSLSENEFGVSGDGDGDENGEEVAEDQLVGFNNGHKFERYLERVEQFQNVDAMENVPIDTEEDEVVENLQKHAVLDSVLDDEIELDDELEEEAEINLAEARIQKGLDNLQIGGS